MRKGAPGSAPPLRDVSSDEVAANTGLIHMKLGEMRRGRKLATDIEYDDLYAVGLLAVWEALRRWRPERGAKSTYISSYIWGRVMDYQRRATKAVGYSQKAGERIATVLSYDFEIAGGEVESLLHRLPAPDDTAAAGEAAARVSTLTRAANRMGGVRRACAMNLLSEDPEPSGDIAARFGVSRQYVQQLTAKIRELFLAVDAGLDVLPEAA